jgi:CubicO group peptidase (beta-lactamase class C family)
MLTSAERAKVDEVFGRYVKADSPGCALGVYRNGTMAYGHGYGMASLELGVLITPQTVFDIGSTSKQFTAFAILLLEQQGKLSLDDDVRKFIPELPDYGKTITLRHLMTHTSGIRDYNALFELAGVPSQNLTTDQDALDLLVRQKALNFPPGEEWDYSNSGFFLLSQVVKRASGKSLRDFSQENIFKPLGMTSTQIFNDHTLVIPHRATGYSYDPERNAFGVEMSNFEQTGDGSVQTSVEDLLRWDENYYTGKVGGPDLVRRMQMVGKLNNGKEHGYAAGLMISAYRGQPIVSHGGAWAGYRAELLRFPQQHTSVAVLCNLAQSVPSMRARKVADVVLASILKPEPSTPPTAAVKGPASPVSPDVLRGYAGVYKDEKGEYQRIDLKDGKLLLASYGIELKPQSATIFRIEETGGQATFSADKTMTLELLSGKQQKYSWVETQALKDLAGFAGDYYSPELDATYEFRVQDGQLTAYVKHGSSPAMPLNAVGQDLFMFPGGTIQFVSRPGEKTRAVLSVARMRNMELVRTN